VAAMSTIIQQRQRSGEVQQQQQQPMGVQFVVTAPSLPRITPITFYSGSTAQYDMGKSWDPATSGLLACLSRLQKLWLRFTFAWGHRRARKQLYATADKIRQFAQDLQVMSAALTFRLAQAQALPDDLVRGHEVLETSKRKNLRTLLPKCRKLIKAGSRLLRRRNNTPTTVMSASNTDTCPSVTPVGFDVIVEQRLPQLQQLLDSVQQGKLTLEAESYLNPNTLQSLIQKLLHLEAAAKDLQVYMASTAEL
jgi:hypothetical protein